jgi:hypothetical protein
MLKKLRRMVRRKSLAVRSDDLEDALSFLGRQGRLLPTFQAEQRMGSRVAEANVWDKLRDSVEARIHPGYFHRILYATLTLRPRLNAHFGGEVALIISESAIAHRASLLERNSFRFLEEVATGPTGDLPAGFRATWRHRGALAAVKLAARLHEVPADSAIESLLEEPDEHDGGAYIEVHIWESLSQEAIEAVLVALPVEVARQRLAVAVAEWWRALGVTVRII